MLAHYLFLFFGEIVANIMEIVFEWLMTEISVSRYPCENDPSTGKVDCFSFEEGGGLSLVYGKDCCKIIA